MSGHHYRDPAVLDREVERIFRAAWLLAGREEQVAEAGAYFTFELGRESVLVVRGRDRVLRAFHNVCRHRGAQLCEPGTGRFSGAIHCPYHAWSYGLDGSLRAVPNAPRDASFAQESLALYPAAVDAWAGFVFVRLEPAGEPLTSQLGRLPERAQLYPLAALRVGARAEREVAANWKILVENFMECYHCPGVHPELSDLVPLYGSGEMDASGEEPPEFREGVVTATRDGTTRRPIFTALRGRPRQRYHAEWVPPNLLLYLFPDYVCARTLWPEGPTRTRIVSEWLFDPDVLAQREPEIDDAVAFLNLLGEQDWRVCEAVQRGIASRAHARGILLPQEAEVGEVIRWYLERMGADDSAP